ncbi:MAG: bactofilin family protein [Lacibacter sp.]
MFNKQTITTGKETTTGLATIIAAGTEIHGNIESKGDLRVDGLLVGNLKTASRVIVGPAGQIRGDVEAQHAEVLGKINGSIRIAELLSLKGNCEINGNIYTGQLQVDATASFNGECHMGSSGAQVVTIGNETNHAAAGVQ